MAQLRLAHDLRNELVAIEQRYEQMHAAVWLSFADVAAAQQALDAATEAVGQAAKAMREARVRNQSTVPATADKAVLAVARTARREAKDRLRAVKAELREQMRERRAELDAAKRYAMSKDNLYRDWVQARGLGWGTYNDVLDRHRTAVDRVGAARRAGQAAQLRFHRWDGGGTITVQVQRRRDGAMRTQWELRPPRPAAAWTGRPRRVAEQTAAPGRRTLWLQVGRARAFGGPLELELPVVAHRPVPEGTEVTYVRVTRRLVGGRPRLSVTLTAREPHPLPPQHAVPVAVVFGWTGVGQGAVRVARVSTPFGALADPPASITAHPFAGVLVAGAGWVDVHAPAEWRVLLEHADSIHAHRDELLDKMKAAVAAALSDATLAEQVGVGAADVVRWRAARRMDALARRWPPGHPLADVLAGWRLRDRHLWAYEANERDQVVARRRDGWRKVADWVCARASEVLLDCPPVAELRQRPPVDEEDDHQARGSRRAAQFAAPADLRVAIEVAAARRGVKVIDVRSEPDGS